MPTVVGNGPVEVTSARGGLISVPLSALEFNGSVLSVSQVWKNKVSPHYDAADQPNIDKLLAYLAERQIVIPAAAGSPKPAAVITAGDAGSTGNKITVTVEITTPSLDPTLVKFNLSVAESILYTGLTMETIEDTLGSDVATGTKPGLVHVIHAPLDKALMPDAGSYPMAGGGANTKSTGDVKSGSKTVFTLEARAASTDGDLITVDISNVQAPSFDMTVGWTQKVAGLMLADLPGGAAPLSYVIGVAAPAGAVFSVPAEGSTTLSGGSDGTSPTTAKATLFANQ